MSWVYSGLKWRKKGKINYILVSLQVPGCGSVCCVFYNDCSQWKVMKSSLHSCTCSLPSETFTYSLTGSNPSWRSCNVCFVCVCVCVCVCVQRSISVGGWVLVSQHHLSRVRVCVYFPHLIHKACVALYGKWALWCEPFQPIRLLLVDQGGGGSVSGGSWLACLGGAF